MSTGSSVRTSIDRIEVRLKVGGSLLAASDDPLYLGLRGPSGREFRLLLAHGRSLRRGADDRFILGGTEANVEHPELNNPTLPPLGLADVDGVYLRKGFEPIPNVRGVGELDDRLEVVDVEVALHADGQPEPRRFARQGPIWLGLVSGLQLEVPRVESNA